MKISAIVTGATGMVGEGVLHECLLHPDVEKILVINRRPCGVSHPKLTEIIHTDFFDLSPVLEKLKGYNACYFCLGVSSIRMKEDEFYRLTYGLTLNFAKTVSGLNPDMTFCYVSGAGTDSTEKGRAMWARVKGKTENDIMKLSFKSAYMFRPGFMKPTKGLKNTLWFYRGSFLIYPLLRLVFPGTTCTLSEVGIAMINAALYGYEKNIIEVRDIVKLTKK